MTKIEELRDEVYLTLVDDYDGYGNEDSKKSAAKLVDELIVAAKAEGAEQMKTEIRRASRDLNRVYEIVGWCAVVPLSILALPGDPIDGHSFPAPDLATEEEEHGHS